METLLQFSSGKRRLIVRHVRRDPKFAPQLYFLTTEEEGGDLRVLVEQVVWDASNNQVASFTFLKLIVPPHTQFALDEKDQWIYVVFTSAKEWPVLVHIKRFQLQYEKPDKFGYRHIDDADSVQRRSYDRTVRMTNIKDADLSVAAIDVGPSTAELILHCKCIFKTVLGPKIAFSPFGLDKCAGSQTPLLNPLQSHEMEARSQVFSRSNDLLTLISYHARNPPEDAKDAQFKNNVRRLFPDGYMILCSHNSQIQLINNLEIDHIQLLQSFLPKTLLNGLKTSAPDDHMPDFMYFGAHLQLLGHVHKYLLFFFHHNYVLSAKWQKDWYKLQQVPKVQQKRVICLEKLREHGQIQEVCLLSTDLFFKIEESGAEAISKLSLGHQFKDYRTCAFCGQEEKRKKKNQLGKRMSSFKVCRLCKELNLHKCYTEERVKCHYCSLECMRKHWKGHKKVHSEEKLTCV